MKRTPFIAAAVLVALLTAFALGPIGALVVNGLSSLGAKSLSIVATPAVWASLKGTVTTSVAAAAFAFAVGLPLALLLERTDLLGRRALKAVLLLPSAVPPFVQAMSWVALANPKAGFLNRWLGAGTVDIYGTPGIAFVLGVAGLPLVLLSASTAVSRLDAALEEAARICGASPWRTLVAVPGRLALPAALSGAALVFVFAASSFGVPYLLGVTITPPTPTLTTHIYTELLNPNGMATAAVLSTLLLAVAALALWLSRRVLRTGQVPLPAGKGARSTPLPLGQARPFVSAFAWLLALCLVGLPLVAVFVTSLTTSGNLNHLSAHHWGEVLGNARTLSAAARSLWLAGLAAALVTAFGLAFALVRKASRLGRFAEWAASVPYAVPGTVLALGLIVTFFQDWRLVLFDRVAFVLALGNTVWLLLIAWVVKHLAFGVRNASEGVGQLDVSLIEAARICGASAWRGFTFAALPQLYAPLTAAFTLTFLTCVTELTLSVLLVPPSTDVLGTLLFELQTYADPSAAAVIACAFVLLLFAMRLGQSLLTRALRRTQRAAWPA